MINDQIYENTEHQLINNKTLTFYNQEFNTHSTKRII